MYSQGLSWPPWIYLNLGPRLYIKAISHFNSKSNQYLMIIRDSDTTKNHRSLTTKYHSSNGLWLYLTIITFLQKVDRGDKDWWLYSNPKGKVYEVSDKTINCILPSFPPISRKATLFTYESITLRKFQRFWIWNIHIWLP